MGFAAGDFSHYLQDPQRLQAAGWGFTLPVVYSVWLLLLAILYPMARWYADLKRQHAAWWMSYI